MESVTKRIALGSNVEISTSPAATAAATGVGIVACGGAFYLLSRAGVPPALAALGGAVLGGIGAFAVVARPRYWDDPAEEAVSHLADTAPGMGAESMVSFLREHLGQEVTAYLSGLEPETMEVVGLWASGEVAPNAVELGRLRSAFNVTRLILELYNGQTAQSWFFGTNPWLGERAPAYVLRYSDQPEVWKSVEEAALAFMGS